MIDFFLNLVYNFYVIERRNENAGSENLRTYGNSR